jgi:hypothetical protein
MTTKTAAEGVCLANNCCQVKAAVIDNVTEYLLKQMLQLADSTAMVEWLAAMEAADLMLSLDDFLPPPATVATLAGVPKREVLRRFDELSRQSVRFSQFVPYLASRLKSVQQAELAAMCNCKIAARAYAKRMPRPRHYAPTYT